MVIVGEEGRPGERDGGWRTGTEGVIWVGMGSGVWVGVVWGKYFLE